MTWRPFEPSLDEQTRIERDREKNRCNLHSDCADAEIVELGGRSARHDGWAGGRFVRAGEKVFAAFHCSIDDCEDCFGC